MGAPCTQTGVSWETKGTFGLKTPNSLGIDPSLVVKETESDFKGYKCPQGVSQSKTWTVWCARTGVELGEDHSPKDLWGGEMRDPGSPEGSPSSLRNTGVNSDPESPGRAGTSKQIHRELINVWSTNSRGSSA